MSFQSLRGTVKQVLIPFSIEENKTLVVGSRGTNSEFSGIDLM